jgi:metal-responsive CopG/Arc/MetJ family transcriptional regulator
MRTTIEIPDKIRAELLALAAKRRMRGYSQIIKEAIELYLQEMRRREKNKRQVLKLEGAWADEDADRIAEAVESAWAGWKTE